MTTEFQAKHWAYTPLVEWLNESTRHAMSSGRSWVHCDQLTLHRPGECRYCDEYAPDAQRARIAREVPFSGELGAPDAFFRPDDTIKRWGGNRPVVATTEGTVLDPTLTVTASRRSPLDEQMREIPTQQHLGGDTGWTRYDTDDEYVLSCWGADGGITHDIRVPKAHG